MFNEISFTSLLYDANNCTTEVSCSSSIVKQIHRISSGTCIFFWERVPLETL